MRALLTVILFSCTTCIFASDEQGQSIMFQNNQHDYENLVTPSNNERLKDEKCKELSKKAEQYKGRPQLRYMAIKKYEAECLRR